MPGIRLKRGRWRTILIGILISLGVYLNWPSSSPPSSPASSSLGDGIRGKRDWEETMGFREKRFTEYQRNQGSRTGPGEMGQGVHLSPEELRVNDLRIQKEGFNVAASEKIALDRSLKDNRDPLCKEIEYPDINLTASVVIIYYNEEWTAILRSVHSVVNRSPPRMLKEVVLLDDSSNRTELGQKLHDYVDTTWPDGIVKIARTQKRSGLIGARIAGAAAASGDVLIFIDAHCEASDGCAAILKKVLGQLLVIALSKNCFPQNIARYPRRSLAIDDFIVHGYHQLEPLLARIQEKRDAVLCPSIDAISSSTLVYGGSGFSSVGGFSWGLHFTWQPIPQRELNRRKTRVDPVRSPTMAGGLLAIGRDYFWELGAYDAAMEIWGGENLEMSFRIWMCGGSLEFIPCSRVGHIFRSTHPYGFPSKTRDYHGLNSKRLAEVWMDEYKRLFYMQRRDLVDKDAGDVSDRIAVRKRLKCHDFKWYLENVCPEKFVLDEDVYAWGQVRNPETGLCLDTMAADEKVTFMLRVYGCQSFSWPELFALSKANTLRREDVCAIPILKNNGEIKMDQCVHHANNPSTWHYNKDTKQLRVIGTSLCLDVAEEKSGGKARVRECNGGSSQQWDLENIITSQPPLN